MTFEEKVKSMTAKEIILATVDGLENPVVDIDMENYGEVVKSQEGVKCYGCAATNAICKIGEYVESDLIVCTGGLGSAEYQDVGK